MYKHAFIIFLEALETPNNKNLIQTIHQGYYIFFENSDEFKEWFKGSKVVDEEGNPILVYHGTTDAGLSGIKERGFDPNKLMYGPSQGFSFSKDKSHTNFYNKGGLVKAYLSLKNPMNFDTNFKLREKIIKDLTGKNMKQMTTDDWIKHSKSIDIEFRKQAETLGYDGIYDENQPQINAFYPHQIKIIEAKNTLTESYYKTVETTKAYIDVFVNPSDTEIKKVLSNQYREAKGLMTEEGKLFVFAPWAEHNEIIEKLDIETPFDDKTVSLMIYPDNISLYYTNIFKDLGKDEEYENTWEAKVRKAIPSLSTVPIKKYNNT